MSVIDAGQEPVDLLAAVVAIQRQFIAESEPQQAFEHALGLIVERSRSEFGFIGEVLSTQRGELFLKVYATSGVTTNESFRKFYEKNAPDGMEFHQLDNLFGAVIRTNKVVISNSPAKDPRSGGLPPGHPPLKSFLGLPIFGGKGELVGMAGLANRRGGYDDALAARLQPLCDALGVMIFSIQRDRRRRESEAALRANEARLRIFADHVTDGLFLQDAETRVVDVNQRACESLGYTRDEMIGMRRADFDSEITDVEINAYAAQLATGETIAFDSRHRRKDGSEFPVEIRVSPLWIDGKPHTLALACDITERKRAEAKLQESEERLELALTASRTGVWEWDIGTNAVFWSPECYDIYGNKSFDGQAESFRQMLHPDDLEPLGETVQRTLDEGTINSWEFRVIGSDRQVRWIANCAAVRRDELGRAIKLIGTARDITEQKLAEDALRQSTLLLENVVENIPLAVFVKDPQDDFRIRLWNKAAESIFGIAREEMVGRNAHDYWPKEQADLYQSVDQKVMKEGVFQDIAEEPSNPHGGNSVFLRTRKMPLFDRNGKPTLLLAICEDITARNRSEAALREAQRRLEFTLQGADVGLWDWNLVTNEVVFSEEWKSQLGYHGDEIANSNVDWESRVHPDDLPRALTNVENAIERRTAEYRSEFRMRHKDGSWRWILSRGSVIDDAHGKPAGMLGVHIDITDRKRAEEALQASESRYRSFVDHATDALFLQDHTGRVVDVNEQACVSLGYDRDELIGMMPVEFDSDVTPEYTERVLQRLETGETVAFDSRHRRQDGSTFPVEVRLRPFRMNDERFHIGLVRDITERKRAEQALRESEARLRTLLENIDRVAVQAYEPDGTITFWNRASELFYGYSAEQALGRDLVELLYAKHTHEQERRIMSEALRTGKPPGAEEMELVRHDGSKITVLTSRVVHPRAGKQPEFFCFDVDITDRKRAEEELTLRQAELLHASRLSTVGQMVAEISHEVAQPLNAIGNFAAASERILETGVDGQMSTLCEYVRAILDQNQRCITILDRLRDFSRRAPASRTSCDIGRLLHDSVDLVSLELRRNQVRIQFELADKLPPVSGDRIQLQQVIVNLLTNARDALLEQPDDRRTITVRAFAAPDAIVFEVEDHGTGLAGDVTVHLFDPFFTTKRHGMGIGLSICQSIVKDHSGRIEAISNPSGGATFRVRLPISRKKGHD